MNLEVLKALDISAGTSGLDPTSAAATLNAPSVPTKGYISVSGVRSWGADKRRLHKLQQGSKGLLLNGTEVTVPLPLQPLLAVDDIRNYCDIALLLFTDSAGAQAFDTASVANEAMIDALVAVGVLDESADGDKTALMAAGETLVSPAQNAGLGRVRPGEITAARGLS